MIEIINAKDRGRTRAGWLDSRHTFSFGHYYDPARMGFRALRVINDDRVAPGGGFPPHPHRDMEIISYVVEGAMEHEDSLGTGSVIRAGDVQRMSAGSGIRHSEFNHYQDKPLRFLQIWIEPDTRGAEPGYGQRPAGLEQAPGELLLLLSPDGQDESLAIRQDARLYGAKLEPGQRLVLSLEQERHGWLQMVTGALALGSGEGLEEGDGVAMSQQPSLELVGGAQGAEILFFDLA